jgi:SAM-dependent methyltransferase
LRRVHRRLSNQIERDEFVIAELNKLAPQSLLLDAGCGSQRYRKYCSHLRYKAQDFGEYKTDAKKSIGTDGMGGLSGYAYGKLDYVGNVWDIHEEDGIFDAILCTEVLEHIPYPIQTIKEFSRLLRPGGSLILTAPSNCLRHMDPFYFSSGFSDRWYEKILSENGFRVELCDAVGDYYGWLAVEMARVAESHSIVAKIVLAPAFVYLFSKRKTQESVDTLCSGYHVVATRI